MNFLIRPVQLGDKSFIYSTWLLGLYHGNEWFRRIEKSAYFSFYKIAIERIISEASINVVCLEDDNDVILGYVVFRGDTLDWIFVKKAWRKLGIAKKLLPPNIKTMTHLTKLGERLAPKEWDFNPFK